MVKSGTQKRTVSSDSDLSNFDSRAHQILSVARDLFAEKGYDGTSIRDIADAISIKTASIYYHFASKEDLFVEVMGRGISKIYDAVHAAIGTSDDPWTRLERAAIAHCEAMLEQTEGFRVLISPKAPASLGEDSVRKLVVQRRAHERMIAAVIDDLDLPPHVDRRIFMFTYLAAINGTAIWYRQSGSLTPAEIARQTVSILRGDQAKFDSNVDGRPSP